jgi:hypothetical protein
MLEEARISCGGRISSGGVFFYLVGGSLILERLTLEL